MYIHRLQIENLRCFESAHLDFVRPSVPAPPPEIAARFGVSHLVAPPKLRVPNVNLLLGDNGAGKTTVLRAIALSLLGPLMVGSSGWVPYRMIRRRDGETAKGALLLPTFRLQEQDYPHRQNYPAWDDLGEMLPGVSVGNFDSLTTSLQINITSRGDLERLAIDPLGDGQEFILLYEDHSPAFFVLGYGATRRAESSENFDSGARSKTRVTRYQRVAGLFEDHVTLVPLDSWLPFVEENSPTRFQEVCSLFNALLPGQVEITSTKLETKPLPYSVARGHYYLFRFGDSKLPFAPLSDGYRAYISWIGDMLYHLVSACPLGMKLTDCRGVVMVDEIDLHLHPSWQRVVVDTLSQTFPRLQFIFTTHSPIVAGTLEGGNIWVMETNDDGSVTPKRYQERIFGLSADQILTSSYFNLLTTRAPQAEAEIRDLAERVGNGDADASLEILRRLTGNIDANGLSDTEIVIP